MGLPELSSKREKASGLCLTGFDQGHPFPEALSKARKALSVQDRKIDRKRERKGNAWVVGDFALVLTEVEEENIRLSLQTVGDRRLTGCKECKTILGTSKVGIR